MTHTQHECVCPQLAGGFSFVTQARHLSGENFLFEKDARFDLVVYDIHRPSNRRIMMIFGCCSPRGCINTSNVLGLSHI